LAVQPGLETARVPMHACPGVAETGDPVRSTAKLLDVEAARKPQLNKNKAALLP